MTDCNAQNKAHQDALKRLAAQKAVELVPEGQIIGIGTGSTVTVLLRHWRNPAKKLKAPFPRLMPRQNYWKNTKFLYLHCLKYIVCRFILTAQTKLTTHCK